MSDGWIPTHLGAICTTRRGISYAGNEVSDEASAGVPFLTIKNFLKGGGFTATGLKFFLGADAPAFRLTPGSLLVANTDVTRDADIIGAPLIVPALESAPLFSMDVSELVASSSQINKRFLFHRLCNTDARAHMKGASAGSTVLHLSVGQALELAFKLPPPAEQSAIARILDTLDTQIEKTQTLIAKLEQVKEGLLHDLLTRGVDENGELRPSAEEAPELYKESALGLIPRGWEIKPIAEEFDIQLGKMLDEEKNSGTLLPYLGNKAVQWGRIDLGSVGMMRLDERDRQRFRLQKGDLLVCEGGEIGRAAIWNDELHECYYQKALHRLRPTGSYLPQLLLQFLRVWTSRDMLAKHVIQTSIAHLTKETLQTLPVPVPVVGEQVRLCATIQQSEETIGRERAYIYALKTLKSGLMDDLLTGRVRVTPLLEREPAEAT